MRNNQFNPHSDYYYRGQDMESRRGLTEKTEFKKEEIKAELRKEEKER